MSLFFDRFLFFNLLTMTSQLIEKYKNHPIVVRWFPMSCSHSHKWIHYRFYHTFKKLWFDTQRLANTEENVSKVKKNSIIITFMWEYSHLMENYDKSRIIFPHHVDRQDYKKYSMDSKNIYLFNCVRFNRMKFTEKKIWQYITEFDCPVMSTEDYLFEERQIQLFWGCELLPDEMKREPYHYKNTKDVVFCGSWWHNNFIQLEKLRRYCITHWLKFHQYWKHLILREPIFKHKYQSYEELVKKTKGAYIAPAVQWVQADDGYIPDRLFINMSQSVLWVSNNPRVYRLFDEDEIICDRNIGKMMEKAERVIKDRKVDEYTKKAFRKVKEKYTYINTIESLFSAL